MKYVFNWILAIMWGAIALVGFMGVIEVFGKNCAILWFVTFMITIQWTLSKIK